jgi:Potato inhibitor I family
MMQASEHTTPEKATTQSNRRRNRFIYAVLASVVIAGIVGLSWSLTNNDSRNKQDTNSSSSASRAPGLRGSTNEDGAVPSVATNDAGVAEDPTADTTSNTGDNPVAPVDEGATIEQENGDNAPPNNGKISWPELVGRPGEEARSTIMQENPNMTFVQLVPVGSMVTADWREDRVRIYVEEDEAKTVASIPNMG